MAPSAVLTLFFSPLAHHYVGSHMGNLEQNRRRNQVIAERTGEKVRRARDWVTWSDSKLWDAVEDCLRSAEHTQRYMGHIDKTAEAVVASGALEELRLRGVQQELPI